MKTRTLTLISITLLTTLLLGAVAINVLSQPKELKLKVKWKPNEFTMDGYVPDPWIAEVFFAPPRGFSDVDPSTILLEGMYTLQSDPYVTFSGRRLALPFNGYDVLMALLVKAPHMAPGTYEISLEITGNLYDGTPFRGSGSIDITMNSDPSPPP